ncbi:MAG: FGGY family carbohydrate kinase, partial [Eubacteriales bacterium]|nr:FGGY family carbohydrate kinase [Eubacteriales bacterium]
MPYTMGFDFGTASVRALVVDVKDGREMGGCTVAYSVITGALPDGTMLKPDMVLADPAEYDEAMYAASRGALEASGVAAEEIIGVGVDTTSCTMLALDENGRALCLQERFRHNPHAWMKLWKSRSAQKEAVRATEVARARDEEFLHWVGENISAEWLIPKALETFHDAPEVFEAADRIMDLPDYMTMRLTGRYTTNIGTLCFKELGMHEQLPGEDYLREVEPGFEKLRDKMATEKFVRWGDYAGPLTQEAADKLGLKPGIAVAGGSLDGNVPIACLGIYKSGDMLLTLGTSGVLALMSSDGVNVKGLAGSNKDVFLPGFYGYEAGMAA